MQAEEDWFELSFRVHCSRNVFRCFSAVAPSVHVAVPHVCSDAGFSSRPARPNSFDGWHPASFGTALGLGDAVLSSRSARSGCFAGGTARLGDAGLPSRPVRPDSCDVWHHVGSGASCWLWHCCWAM